jgi:hypothetical protein
LRQPNEAASENRPIFARPVPAFLFTLLAIVVGSALVWNAARAVSDHRRLTTGPARWIWYTGDVPEPAPIRFYAGRLFRLGSTPRSAVARVFVDRRWVLRINGKTVGAGAQRPGDRLVALKAAPLLLPGENRIVIQAESPDGVGGILFALDLDGEKNSIVSDGSWRVARSEGDLFGGPSRPAEVWGKPPMHPWGYP